jgi:hypothetical protein
MFHSGWRPNGVRNRQHGYFQEGMMRKWIAAWLVSLAMVAGLTTVLMRARDNTKIISGSDFGFRVDNATTERTGKVVGTLVVRVNGNWVEVNLGQKYGLATGK